MPTERVMGLEGETVRVTGDVSIRMAISAGRWNIRCGGRRSSPAAGRRCQQTCSCRGAVM